MIKAALLSSPGNLGGLRLLALGKALHPRSVVSGNALGNGLHFAAEHLPVLGHCRRRATLLHPFLPQQVPHHLEPLVLPLAVVGVHERFCEPIPVAPPCHLEADELQSGAHQSDPVHVRLNGPQRTHLREAAVRQLGFLYAFDARIAGLLRHEHRASVVSVADARVLVA